MYILHEIPNVKYIAARKHVNRRIHSLLDTFCGEFIEKGKVMESEKGKKTKM